MRTPADTHRISAFLAGFLLLESVLSYHFLQPVIPLFYSFVNQEDQLAPKQWIGVFPLLGILVYFTHAMIMKKLGKSEMLTAQMFAWGTVIVEVFFVIALTRIVIIIL